MLFTLFVPSVPETQQHDRDTFNQLTDRKPSGIHLLFSVELNIAMLMFLYYFVFEKVSI